MKQKFNIQSNDKLICPLIEKMIEENKPKKVSIQFFVLQFNMPISVKGMLKYVGKHKDNLIFEFQHERSRSIAGVLIDSNTKIEEINFLPQFSN